MSTRTTRRRRTSPGGAFALESPPTLGGAEGAIKTDGPAFGSADRTMGGWADDAGGIPRAALFHDEAGGWTVTALPDDGLGGVVYSGCVTRVSEPGSDPCGLWGGRTFFPEEYLEYCED